MRFIVLSLLLVSSALLYSSDNFNKYFLDETLRIDYFHVGDSKTEIVTIDKLYRYGIWAGSRVNTIDKFNNGRYYIEIFDLKSGKKIFSKGFDSYFGEYKTTGQAAKGIMRTYQESMLIPFPKSKIRFSMLVRDRNKKLNEIFSTEIDPSDVGIIRDRIIDPAVSIFKDLNGDPHGKVDIVILGEGYSAEEKAKFDADFKHFVKIHFKWEPYKSHKDKFNFYGVYKASEESGVDEPRAGIYKNSVLNATFNSLGSERYLLTEDNKAMRDLAAHVPYDAIYIMVNSKRYGGGGIYNFYCTFTADNQFHEYLFIHEFGHSFTGLADEYYTSSTSYNDFYPAGVEPGEANITALVDPKNLKWKDMLTEGLSIPTPWEKDKFDKTDGKWQKERKVMNNRIAELKRNKAPKAEIEKAEQEYVDKDRKRSDEVDEYLKKCEHYGKVGVFEGAGYASKGLYRPMLDCIMFSKGDKPFCKVCEKAIISVIMHYTE